MTRPDRRPVALVLRALHLGDLLTGLPALSMLRSALPDHRIVLAVPPAYARLAMAARVVDDTTPGWELEPLSQAPRGADIAIDLHGNGPESVALLAATDPKRLVAYWGGAHQWRAEEHEVRRWCRLIAEEFGVARPWPGIAGRLPPPEAPGRLAGSVIVHPGASAAARRWPAQRYASVVTGLCIEGHRVVVTAGAGEAGLAADVCAGIRATPATAGLAEVAADLSLEELLGLIAAAPLLVSGDTGVAHAAAVFGTPSVTLFGPVSPTRWGPPADSRHACLWHGAGPADTHGDEPDPALLAISVEEVVDAIGTVLDAAA